MHEKAAATLTKLCNNQKPGRQSINFIRLVLNTKTVAFSKVIKMDGAMVVLLKSDPNDANNTKEYYKKQFDDAYDKNKELERQDHGNQQCDRADYNCNF